MAERAGDPEVLGRIAANRPILARLADGAQPTSGGIGPWSPDGWVMRTHPDVSEAAGRVAPDDLRMVYGIAAFVDAEDRIYAAAMGTSSLWLRVPSGPAYDDAIAGGVAEAVDGLAGWIRVDVWRSDIETWMRASAALTRDLVRVDA